MPNTKHSRTGMVFVSETRAVAEALIRALELKHARIFLLHQLQADSTRVKVKPEPQILWLNAGGEPDVPAILRTLRRLWPSAPFIVLGVPDQQDTILRCLHAGADGIVLRDESLTALKRVEREVRRNGHRLPPRLARPLFHLLLRAPHPDGERPSPTHLRPLSAREIEALDQLALGKSNKEVAAALGVAEQTAKNHVARVMRKLGVRSRHDAARMALAQLRGQAA